MSREIFFNLLQQQRPPTCEEAPAGAGAGTPCTPRPLVGRCLRLGEHLQASTCTTSSVSKAAARTVGWPLPETREHLRGSTCRTSGVTKVATAGAVGWLDAYARHQADGQQASSSKKLQKMRAHLQREVKGFRIALPFQAKTTAACASVRTCSASMPILGLYTFIFTYLRSTARQAQHEHSTTQHDRHSMSTA